MNIDSASGLVTWPAAFVSPRVKITVTDGLGGKVVHGYALPVVTQLSPGSAVVISGDANSTGYATITVPPNTPVLQVTMRGGSGDSDLDVLNPDGLEYFSARDKSTTETLSFPNPEPGEWQVQGLGYTSYSGVSLTASLITPAVVGFNSTLSGLNGNTSSETFYRSHRPFRRDSIHDYNQWRYRGCRCDCKKRRTPDMSTNK